MNSKKGGNILDYIRQINAFENWLEFNEIGPGPQLLWYKLMRVANISGWQIELSIANTRLQSMTKTSEKTLINNRNQLIQNGLLQYKKRGRTKAGIYVLTDLTTGNIPVKEKVEIPTTGISTVDTTVKGTVIPTVKPTVVSSVDSSAYINKTKLNETKLNNHDDDVGEYPAELVQRLYNQFPSGRLQGAIADWLKEWSREMICIAIQSSFDYGKEAKDLIPYVGAIFNRWKTTGIDTAEKAIAANEQFKARSKNQGYPKTAIRKEPIPEWMDKPYEAPEADPEQQEALNRRLQEYLARKEAQA